MLTSFCAFSLLPRRNLQCLLLLSVPKYATWLPTGVTLPAGLLAVLPPAVRALAPAGELGGVAMLALLALPFWALKQATNVLQGQLAAQRLVAADAK